MRTAQTIVYALCWKLSPPFLLPDMCFDVLVYLTKMGCLLFGSKDHPQILRTVVLKSNVKGMTVNQVSDEVIFTGLIEMQELDVVDQSVPRGEKIPSNKNIK